MFDVVQRPTHIRSWLRSCLWVIALGTGGTTLSACAGDYNALQRTFDEWFGFDTTRRSIESPVGQRPVRSAPTASPEPQKSFDSYINEVFRELGEKRQPGLDGYSGYTF